MDLSFYYRHFDWLHFCQYFFLIWYRLKARLRALSNNGLNKKVILKLVVIIFGYLYSFLITQIYFIPSKINAEDQWYKDR